MNANQDLKAHHIYLLQIMAQPAEVQICEYEWASDDVPVGIFDLWTIAFTATYLIDGNEELLPGFDDDIIEIDQKRKDAMLDQHSELWTNKGLKCDIFWEEIRNMSAAILTKRGIPMNKPDPKGWYLVLPEELH